MDSQKVISQSKSFVAFCFLLILSLFFSFSGNQLWAQTCPNNTKDIRTCFTGTPGCNGTDVTLVSISVGDPDIPCETCIPGTEITLPVIGVIQSDNNGNRCTFTIGADVLINGIQTCVFQFRVDTCVSSMGTYSFQFGELTFTCGDDIVLDNVIIGWATNGNDNGNDQFCPSNAKCGLPDPIRVKTPLIASCLVADSIDCFGEMGQVTAIVTGGTPPYSFLWSTTSTDSVITVIPGTYSVTVTDDNNCTSSCSVTLSAGPTSALTLQCVDGAVSCNGDTDGSVSVNPSGGTPPYSYLWDSNAGNSMNQTVSNLGAGMYSVTVTDANGCMENCTATISAPPPLTCSASENSPVVCNGETNGSATVTPSGGNGGYTYSWDNGEMGPTAIMLSGGMHSVTVTDANNCTTSCSVVIGEPALLTCTAMETSPVVCNGESNGSATVMPTGGNGGYTYLWDNNETNATATMLSAGMHSVTVTDAKSCTTTCSVMIGEPPLLTCTAAPVSPVACNGESNGSAIVTPAGGNPGYTYLWDNNETSATATMLSAGMHSVTVTDAKNCTTTCSVTISEPAPLTCTATEVSPATCNGAGDGSATVTPMGGNGGYTYLWDNNETTATATMLTAGMHSVTVTDAKNCTTTCMVTINQPSNLTCSASEDSPVRCFGESNGQATVVPTGGNGGYTYLWDNNETNPTATMLTAGLHSVTVTDSENCTTTCTVVIGEPPVLTCAAAQVSPVACNGENNGSATVTPMGGNGGYTYLWDNNETNPTATMLTAGLHSVTVTDAKNCTTTCMVTITEPTSLACTAIQVSPVACTGETNGSATVTPTGGNGGYSYLWDNNETTATATMLGVGLHSVTVTDAENCTTTCMVTITEPAPLTCTATQISAVRCFGENNGSASVTPAGGNGGYTYLWDNNETGPTATMLIAGLHSVTVTDSKNCTSTCTVTISEPPVMTSSASQIQPVRCFGESNGSAMATCSGGNGSYTFNWDNGETAQVANMLAAGTHFVTCTDALGCISVATVVIDQPDSLIATASFMCNLGAPDANIDLTVTGGSPGYTYNWSHGFMGEDPTGVTQDVLYSVTVTDMNGCSDTASVFVTGCCVLELADCPLPNNVSCPEDTTTVAEDIAELMSLIVQNPGPCGQVTINLISRSASGVCGVAPGLQITREYQISDDLTTLFCTKVNTALDRTRPHFTCPPTLRFQCLDEIPPPMGSLAEFSAAGGVVWDNCTIDPDSWIMLSETIGGGCPTRVVRTYQISDQCGNVRTCSRTLLVLDTTAPTITTCLPDQSYDCWPSEPTLLDLPAPTLDPTSFGASDNCSDVTDLMVDYHDIGPFIEGCFYRFERTYSVLDSCGNTTSCMPQNFTFKYDDTPPEIVNAPANYVEFDCFDAVPAVPTFQVVDACGDNFNITFNESEGALGCLHESYKRTWTIEDDCGNITTISQTLVRSDFSAPVISRPADTTILCGEEIPEPEFSITDDCSIFEEDFREEIIPGACACEYTLLRIWYAKSSCGPEVRDTQFISIINPMLEGIENGGSMKVYNCDDPQVLMTDIQMDDCCDIGEVFTYDSIIAFNSCEAFGYYALWICGYRVSDLCGNTSEFRFYVEQYDTVAPHFMGDPIIDYDLDCDDIIPSQPNIFIDDNCPNTPMLSFREDTVGFYPDSFALIRTWEALDVCGNFSDTSQVITICGFEPDSFMASIGNVVWYDVNENGIQDHGELGVDGVQINLYRVDDPDNIPNQTPLKSVTTKTIHGESGQYLFDNLNPGKYVLGILPGEGFIFTQANMGQDESVDSDVDPITGMSELIEVGMGESNVTVDVGLIQGTEVSPGITNFQIKQKDCASVLDWTTHSEINSDFFEIQHSLDGVIFSKVGTITAAGNSTVKKDYYYVDHSAAKKNYYRIKQINQDGSFTYSKVLETLNPCTGIFELVHLFPNPTRDVVTLEFKNTYDIDLTIKVYDQLGRLIITDYQRAPKGIYQKKINLSKYVSGLYFIHLFDGISTQYLPVIKTR